MDDQGTADLIECLRANTSITKLDLYEDVRQDLQQHIDQLLARNQAYAVRWQVNKHHQSPEHIRQAVTTLMMIRAVEHQPSSVLACMPNELMFLVFWYLS
jgi:thiamine phosphate synthase YjbQ (UPF0047 family)